MRGSWLASVAVVVFAAGCTGSEGGGSGAESIDHLVIAPDGATIDTGTTVMLRATGVTEAGRFIEVTDVTWTASAGSVAADGAYSPATAGTVNITAEADGKLGAATLTVVASGSLAVTVVDATTGLPINAAEITLVTSTMGALTIADGTATLTGAFSGSIDVQVQALNYWPMTIYGLKTKAVRIPLRPENPPPGGFFQGRLDFTEAFDSDTEPQGYLWVGIGGPAIKGNILAFGLESLLGPSRPIEFAGIDLDAPSNVYINGTTENYIASAPAGETVAFGLGGEVEFTAITELIIGGTSDIGEVIAELLPIFNTFYYTTLEDVTVASNQTLSGQDLVLKQSLSRKATLTVGGRPWIDPNPLVVAAVDFGPDIGFVPAGLNIVDGENETVSNVRVPPLSGSLADKTYVFLVVSQEGGLGASDTDQQVAVLSRGHTRISDVVTPDFLPAPALATFAGDGAARTFDYAATAGADFLFHTFTRTLVVGTSEGPTLQWDVVAAGDSDGFVLPMILATNGAQTGGDWTVQSLGLQSQTYESLFTPNSPIDSSTYFNDANRVVITNASVD